MAAPGTFRLASDVNFAHNVTTKKEYNRFVGKQEDWYAAASSDPHVLFSLLLGVATTQKLMRR